MTLNSAEVPSYTEISMTDQAKKILCIEDDTFLLNLISGKFTDAGIIALGAHTGTEGLLLSLSQNPDLILLDLMLPDTSGLTVLDQLKTEEKTKDIPVIIFSNLGARTEIETGLAHGAHTYLVKSNTLPGELVDAISGVLGIVPAAVQTNEVPA